MRNLVFSIVGLVLGAWCLWIGIDPESGVPKATELKSASGSVMWAEATRYAVRFRLSGANRTYVYPLKAGNLAEVSSFLSPAVSPKVSVLYGPSKSGESQVWEITAQDRQLRTYEQVSQSWTEDNHWARWGGLALLLAAAYLYRESRRADPGEA